MKEVNEAQPNPQPQPNNFTMDQLQNLLKTVLEESKKPAPPTEEEQRKRADALEARRSQAELVLQMMEQKKLQQKLCSHMRRDGTTRVVYIQNGGYLLCQKCQAKLRPEEKADEFNRLFQLIQPTNYD